MFRMTESPTYAEARKERNRLAARKWKAANREKVRAAARARYAANPEKEIERYRAYRQANRAKYNAARREEYETNQEKREQRLRWAQVWRKKAYELDPGRIKSRNNAWAKRNPEAARLRVAARRAAKLAAPGRYTKADIQWLMGVQRGQCAHSWCRRPLKSGRHVDHIVPLALGGSNGRRNLQLLCPHCNLSKRDRHPIDHAQKHGLLL